MDRLNGQVTIKSILFRFKRSATVIFQFLADYCTRSFSKVYGAIPADFINTLMIMNQLHLQGTHEYLRKVEYPRIWLEPYG